MTAISETLRQARLRSGLGLDILAAKTKINPRYLEAIEAGEFDKLPSGSFARMFIKQYADAIGLDGASFAEEFQRTTDIDDSGPNLRDIVNARSNFRPVIPGLNSLSSRFASDRVTSVLSSVIWVVTAILVCAGVYYGLAHLPSRHVVRAVTVPVKIPVQSSANTPDHQEDARSVPQKQTLVAAPAGAAPENSRQTANGSVNAPAGDVSRTTAPIQLTVNATAPVWIRAVVDGTTVFSETIPPGASKNIAASNGARITIGDAGAVDITFNGRKLESLGEKGQVRTVDFTSWGAQVVSRTSPANPDPLL